MKLCIKQEIFSLRDKFDITDVNQEVIFTVKGEIFTLGRKLHIYNAFGTEVALVFQKPFSLLPEFTVSISGEPDVIIKKEFTFFRHEYTFYGKNWKVQGDVFAHNYSILHKDGRLIAKIDKEYFTFGDCYTLEISDRRDTLLSLAAVLTIDCVLACKNSD